MKNIRKVLILLITVMGLFGWVSGAQAQPVTVVRVDPVSTVVDPGGYFSVNVMVENVTDLWAFDITVVYDPDYLSVTSVQWGNLLTPGLTIPGIITDPPGIVRCGMSQIAPASAQTGTGVLFTINFTAKELEGETTITIMFAELVEWETYDLIPNSLQNAIVLIGSEKTEFMNYLPLVIR